MLTGFLTSRSFRVPSSNTRLKLESPSTCTLYLINLPRHNFIKNQIYSTPHNNSKRTDPTQQNFPRPTKPQNQTFTNHFRKHSSRVTPITRAINEVSKRGTAPRGSAVHGIILAREEQTAERQTRADSARR